MKRAAAIVGAVAMIGLALLVRSVIDGDEDDADDDRGDAVEIVCVTELAEECRAWDDERDDISVRIEDAATTLAAIEDRSVTADGWLAPRPWLDIAAAATDPRIGAASKAIARSRVALVVQNEIVGALTDVCAGEITWECIGDHAGDSGLAGIDVPLSVGVLDPESGDGLAVLGGAATAYFGGSDFATNDFDGEFDDWLNGLGENKADVAASTRDPINRLITERGRFVVAGALDVEAAQARARSDVAEVIYPSPVATADLALVSIGRRLSDDRRDDLAGDDRLRDAVLERDGWSAPDASGLPKDDNQPSGGVLAALLTRWQEIR